MTQGMGWALEVLNAGGSVARQGWNGKGLSLVLVRAGEWAHTQSGVRAARFVALRSGGVLVPWTCFSYHRPSSSGTPRISGVTVSTGAGVEVEWAARFVALRSGGVLVPWTCSQTDLLAEDWVRVD